MFINNKITNICWLMLKQINSIKLFFLKLSIYTLLFFHYPISASDWQRLAPGIEYKDLNHHSFAIWSHLHVFRINLKKNELSLITAADLSLKNASVDTYAEYSKALLSVNGGFFDSDYRPLGLRINKKQLKNPCKFITWWSIFYTQSHKPHLVTVNKFHKNDNIDFAIQSGPRLIINNHIPRLRPGRAERTALGITRDGKVIILMTEHLPLSTTELAQYMLTPPLNCQDALNLDGGSSSQLYAAINFFKLEVHGFSNISDAIIVTARKE